MEQQISIEQNVQLDNLTTFGVPAIAARYTEVHSEAAMQTLIQDGEKQFLILGGGSNILFVNNPESLVVRNCVYGREILDKEDGVVRIRVGAGENWHDFVCWSLEQGYYGLENLSLIPGTVGAAPIQNIGAYGVELESFFDSLEAIEIKSGEKKIFTKTDCQFGYRDSIFKKSAKGKYLISQVVLRLKLEAEIQVRYGAIKDTLAEMGMEDPGPQDVARAIIQIRQSKLPDPAILGNGGSFFKNPVISKDQFLGLQKTYPEAPYYPINDEEIKIPAAWLIDQCGWKGKRIGNTGAHSRQALVLVNYGGATGKEIAELGVQIADSVSEKFGIRLEREVNVI